MRQLCLILLFNIQFGLANETCNPFGVCVSQNTYAYFGTQPHGGVIKGFKKDGQVQFQEEGQSKSIDVSANDVADNHNGKCSPLVTTVCVGNASERTLEDNSVIDGRIIAVFPSGYVVLDEPSGKVFERADRVTIAPPPAPTSFAPAKARGKKN